MSGFALLLDTFRHEATELLDEMARFLEAQRKNPGDLTSLVEARRVAHNLKGAAFTVGARKIAESCHLLEDGLEARSRAATPTNPTELESWLRLVAELQRAVEDPQLLEEQATLSEVPAPVASRSQHASEDTIRVEARRLDEILGHLREFAQSQVRLARQNQILRETKLQLRSGLAANETVTELIHQLGVLIDAQQQEIQELGYRVDSLAAAMNQVRMIPLAGMSDLWRRTVRETSRELERPVQLEIDVGDVEVDLHLHELLRDPLLHILRNALAHGIEPAQQRLALQKPPTGRIRLAARADGAFVQLQISDDGAGIDPERVARRAVERGWITAAAAAEMSVRERRALIFLPGFSTAEIVTNVAGRGMGLHSVQRNIEELGGSVVVSTAPSLGGTTFELRIPANLLNVKGLLVESRGVTYALPLHDVVQVAAVQSDTLEQSEGCPVFVDATGRPVRVRALDALLGEPGEGHAKVLQLVVLRRTGQELALVVDRVVGEREFVTRGLPWNLEGATGINGTLILDDGSVALFLDTTAILSASSRSPAGTRNANAVRVERTRRILIADDSLSVRTIQAQTLSGAGYEVSAFSDGEQAWEALSREPFDLVVTDVQMPKLNGFELTLRIRSSAALRHLPVVLVTSLHSPADVARGAEVGADEFVIKGEFDQEKLLAAIRRLVG